MISVNVKDFPNWRQQARTLLTQDIEPTLIIWNDINSDQHNFFDNLSSLKLNSESKQQFLIPQEFLALAETIAYHRGDDKWNKLYQALWRLTHGERHLLAISSDPLMYDLLIMQKAVHRDAHKMKAFIRFCKFQETDGGEYYLAWYKPEHLVLRMIAPFFMRRFSVMRWTIITPDETVHWDGEKLIYSEGRYLSENPTDELEHLWQTYYKAIFNPARIKIKAMKKEMPMRYWHNLPETKMISSLLMDAPQRVAEMMRHQEGFNNSAEKFLPARIDSFENLKNFAKNCQGCPLHVSATQTVFGMGNSNARLMLVGEQPGNEEDLQGLPFIGPAGQVLREVFHELSINIEEIYLTNAVKHFKFYKHLTHRTHRSPNIREINACKPWVASEIELVKPSVILCLGLTAAKALINPSFRIKHERGNFKKHLNYIIGATFHPSAILRANNEVREMMLKSFKKDLQKAHYLANSDY
ncbi:MAG: UdgX family uracil-DNA binding protein [Legionella sp.]|nr:UdgX family uracil-DNA binding protein [Legionella sp.]